MVTEIKIIDKRYAAAVVKIEEGCFANPWSKDSIMQSLESERYRFVGCFFGGKLVGYGGVNVISGEAYITNVAVLQEFRGRGCGKAIVRRIVDICTDCEFVTLEVRESNSAAIRLYKKCGFEIVGVREKFYTNPAENAKIMSYYKRGREN